MSVVALTGVKGVSGRLKDKIYPSNQGFCILVQNLIFFLTSLAKNRFPESFFPLATF